MSVIILRYICIKGMLILSTSENGYVDEAKGSEHFVEMPTMKKS